MSKVYLVMQHTFDDVKLFEPIQLSPEEADAMVERLRKSEPNSPEQPIEWRELAIDFSAAKRAVEQHTRPLKERVDALHAQLAELEKGGGIKAVVDKLRLSIAQLLATLDYDTGDFVALCACTSSGNEEPPGSVDVVCNMCQARALLGITKQQDTAELATSWKWAVKP